jgi:GNAT superfamily N-acetyltransferase
MRLRFLPGGRDDPGSPEVRSLRAGDAVAVGRSLRHPVVVADRLARQARGECLYLIAWDGGQAVGQVLLHWRRPLMLAVGPGVDGLPYIEDLFVHPEARRRGAATALLEACHALAAGRGYTGISLAVSLDNAPARRLYTRLGYVDAGVPPRRQSTAEHEADGRVRSSEEVVVDLVRRLERPAPPGSPGTGAGSRLGSSPTGR